MGETGAKVRAKFDPATATFRALSDAYVEAVTECEAAERQLRALRGGDEQKEALAADLALADEFLELVREQLYVGTRSFLLTGRFIIDLSAIREALDESDRSDLTQMSDDDLITLETSEGDPQVSIVKTIVKTKSKKTSKKTKSKSAKHPGAQVCISITAGLYEAVELVRNADGKFDKARPELSRASVIRDLLIPWVRQEGKRLGLSKKVEEFLARMKSNTEEIKKVGKAVKRFLDDAKTYKAKIKKVAAKKSKKKSKLALAVAKLDKQPETT